MFYDDKFLFKYQIIQLFTIGGKTQYAPKWSIVKLVLKQILSLSIFVRYNIFYIFMCELYYSLSLYLNFHIV